MEFTLKLLLDITPRMEQALERVTEAMATKRVTPVIVEPPRVEITPEPVVEIAKEPEAAPDNPERVAEEGYGYEEKAQGFRPEPPKPVELPPVAAETPPPDDKTMRDMMDIVISRICGTNDWRESTDVRVKDLRRSCTACFKEIAARLGKEKPTQLEGQDRVKFLEALEGIHVNEAARRAEWLPF